MEKYIIERDGRIWSKYYKKYLKPYTTKKGYLRTGGFLVHRLVAMKYIPNPHNYPDIDHINRNKTDNRVENLRWVNNMINVSNRGQFKTNTSGHKWITYRKPDKWVFQRQYKHKLYQRLFKTKIECICYKFIHLLLIRLHT